MGLDDQVEKMEIRKNYRNVWHTNLLSTISADTPYCLFSLFCGPCVSYMLRKRALNNDMSGYVCCAGDSSCSERCGESKCPELCLCTEVVCCFSRSVASTRFLLQDEFNIQTTLCDNCIIGFMKCLKQLACICSLGGNNIPALSCLAYLVYCLVSACIQTQHKVEMDKRVGELGLQPVMAFPSVQQMSRLDQPVPPHAGDAPQQAYGQPDGYPPPPQTQGELD